MAKESFKSKFYEVEIEGPEGYCELRMRFYRHRLPQIINAAFNPNSPLHWPGIRKHRRVNPTETDQ